MSVLPSQLVHTTQRIACSTFLSCSVDSSRRFIMNLESSLHFNAFTGISDEWFRRRPRTCLFMSWTEHVFSDHRCLLQKPLTKLLLQNHFSFTFQTSSWGLHQKDFHQLSPEDPLQECYQMSSFLVKFDSLEPWHHSIFARCIKCTSSHLNYSCSNKQIRGFLMFITHVASAVNQLDWHHYAYKY